MLVADIIFLNFLVDDRWAIGQYAFCLTIVIILDLCTSTLQQTLIPHFSLGGAKHKEIHQLFIRYQKLFYVGVIILPLFIYFLAMLVIPMIYGNKFHLSLDILPFTLLCWSLKSLSTLKSVALFGGDRVHISSYISILNFSISLLFLWFGYTLAGFMGILVSKNFFFLFSYLLIGFIYYFIFIRKK
jgi:O-antigen/teichoic acid export membrane protein